MPPIPELMPPSLESADSEKEGKGTKDLSVHGLSVLGKLYSLFPTESRSIYPKMCISHIL